jgi:hypothetical protein
LLADAHPDPELTDFTTWPWVKVHHLDGRPFSAGELALVNAASVEEAQAAQRLMQATYERRCREETDLGRMRELLGLAMADGNGDLPVRVILPRLPPELYAEAIALWREYAPGDLEEEK